MGFRQWLGNKLFDINKTIENEVSGLDNEYNYIIPGREQVEDRLHNFRQNEYRLWSRSNANELGSFYGTYKISPDELVGGDRQLFWEWSAGIKNIPKIHYPAPEIIMNQMKSLLFAEELTISVNDEDGEEVEEAKELLDEMLESNNFYELLQTGSYMETYSGTLGARFIVDSRYEDHPIIKLYPAEKIRFKDFMGRIQEIIFLDEYMVNKKKYTLRSIYGKGYINYQLLGPNKKQVPLDTIDELADLKDVVILGKDGKPLKKLLACVKKNRSVSAEFPDGLYGGSDFEGIVDVFHFIDEIYSTKNLYARRTRPTQSLTEDRLEWNDETKVYITPKEYEQDTIILKATSKPEDNGFFRDVPEVNFKPYDDSIHDELKNIFRKIGMAYTSVGLEAHSANISGAALVLKEKPTVIVRANKIKLWKKFLNDLYELLFLYEDLLQGNYTDGESITFRVNEDELFKYKFNTEFPHYNETSFDERLDQVIKGLNAGAFDLETAIDRLFTDETEEEKIKIKIKTKIENQIPFIGVEEAQELEEAEPDETEEDLEEEVEENE